MHFAPSRAPRHALQVDEDYEEPLLTVVEGDGASTSTGSRQEHTRAAIISVESDYSLYSRTWQQRNAFRNPFAMSHSTRLRFPSHCRSALK